MSSSCQEARPQQDAVGAECEHRGQPSAIGDTAGSKHRQRGNGLHDHRHQCHGGHPADVASALGDLSDDHISLRLGSANRFGHLAGHVHGE